MPTYNQLLAKRRKPNLRKSKAPALQYGVNTME
jgi:hypothetical protein